MKNRCGHTLRKLHNCPRGFIFKSDLVNSRHQRQLITEMMLFHYRPNLLSGERALKLLATQEFFLDIFPAFCTACFNICFCTLSVPPTETCRDKICNTAAFQGSRVFDIWVKVTNKSF